MSVKKLRWGLLLLLLVVFIPGCALSLGSVDLFLDGIIAGTVGILDMLFWPMAIILFLWISWAIGDEGRDYESYDGYGYQSYHPIAAGVCFALFLAIMQVTSRVDFITFAKTDLLLFAEYFAGYFVIGAVWSIFKTYRAGKAYTRNFIEKEKKRFLEKNGNNEEAWLGHLNEKDSESSFSRKKLPIKTWILYWPFSALWFLLHDPIQRLVSFIARILKDVHRFVYELATKEVAAEYKKAEAYKLSKANTGKKKED
jgi:hypothetical protein